MDASREKREEVMKMFYYENRSCREIASILRIGEGTVKVRLHRARAMVRKVIEERAGPPQDGA